MRKVIAVVAAGLLFLAACGDDDPTNADRPEDGVEPTIVPEVAGESVVAPTPTAVVLTVEPDALTYTVQSGDTMGIIAQNFGVSVAELAEANSIDDPDLLSVGQTLVIPDPADE